MPDHLEDTEDPHDPDLEEEEGKSSTLIYLQCLLSVMSVLNK